MASLAPASAVLPLDPALPTAPAPASDAAAALTPMLAAAVPAAAAPAAAPAAPAVIAGAASAPAAQVAPALIQVAHAAGGHQITVRLDPVELGRVDVRIERATDGTASVQVLAERPETLKLLQADQAQLHRTLDSAGVPAEGRSLTLSLALPDPGAGSNPQAGGFGLGGGGGQPGGTRQDRAGPGTAAPLNATATAPVWQRAGIDITA